MHQPVTRSIELPDEAASRSLARRLAGLLPQPAAGWTVLLRGELGAGKSTVAREMLRAMGHDGPVPSPTYTLVEPYEMSDTTVYHIDLYRISNEEELEFLGWDELSDGLRLIEWPERAARLEGEADIEVVLNYAGSGRRAEVTGASERGAGLVSQLSVN